ncbi:MAG: NHLP leader peptide family RiPP precursor [Bradyrhizobium sp.]
MNQEAKENWDKRWSYLVAKSWGDAAFKNRLLSDPREILREAGVEIPSSVRINITEDSESVINLVLPPSPAGELSTQQLEGVAGGVNWNQATALHRHYSSPWLRLLKIADIPS